MQNQGLEGIQEESQQEDEEARESVVDLIVTHDKTSTTKQLSYQLESFDHLKDTLRKQFSISDDFMIKFLNEDGGQLELTGNNFKSLKDLKNQRIRLEIEVLEEENIQEEEEYEEDFVEEEEVKEYRPKVTDDMVKPKFKDLRLILQIKEVKKSDILKYILHEKKAIDGHKVKKVDLKLFVTMLEKRIGLGKETSELIGRFLIEKPSENDGQVLILDPSKVTISRKDLNQLLQMHIEEYSLYNSFAIT